MPIRVLIADDHPVVRSGLASLLSGNEIQVVAEASTTRDAVRLAAKHKPVVVLLDVWFGSSDGLKAIETIRRKQPKVRVIVLSAYDSPTYIARAAVLGASDYLLKGVSRTELIHSIRAACKGEPPGSYGELGRMLELMRKQDREPELDVRASRQLQTLRHVALGLSNKEIAQSMGIGSNTVKDHLKQVMKKLKLNDRTQLAVWAVKNGLVA